MRVRVSVLAPPLPMQRGAIGVHCLPPLGHARPARWLVASPNPCQAPPSAKPRASLHPYAGSPPDWSVVWRDRSDSALLCGPCLQRWGLGGGNQRSPVSGAIGRLASLPHLRATSGRLRASCRSACLRALSAAYPPRLSPLRGAPSGSNAPLFLGGRHVSASDCVAYPAVRPSHSRREQPRTAPASCPPPPPLPAPLRCCANSHHVHRLVCSGWKVHTDLLLGLATATAALGRGLALLVVLLGRHPAQPQGEPTALSPQHTAGSNDVCELWLGSTPRQGQPRGASTLVRQGQSAQALRQRVAQVPEGRLGLHAAAGLSRLSGRLLSREMCGQVRQAGPQAWRDAASPFTLEGRRVYEGRKARPLWLRESRRIIKHINEARKTRGGCRTGPCPVISTPVRLAPLPDYQTLWRRLPDWPLPRHLYPCTVRLDQEWTSGPDSLAAPRQAPRGSAR